MSWVDEVEKIKAWVDQNLEEYPSLAALSSARGYSSFYLSKKFHEIEGVSLKKYLLAARIQHAAAQLLTTDDRILDIAMSHGYSSQEAFTRAFVRVYRITPWTYRKLKKPYPTARKSRLLCAAGFTKPIGGIDMKVYVKQLYDWNRYAYYAEDVDEKYWDYFQNELWWQVDSTFIKTYDNVQDFEYCAENFTKFGELAIRQQLKILPAPWKKALAWFAAEIQPLGVDWFVHGSAAMALWGMDVAPKDVNVILPNAGDFDVVRNHFCKFAIRPIERCENWLMSGLGNLFAEALIEIAFRNPSPGSYDMSQHKKIPHHGTKVHIATLEMLRQDNESYGRPERVRMIEDRMKQGQS